MADALRGGVAVITGAASGIGASLATALAKCSCSVALADVNETGLAQVAEKAAKFGVAASTHVLDVADADAVAAFPSEIQSRYGKLTILVNNAGVALNGQFDQVSLDDFTWLMDINFWGVVRMTKAFLPMLRREPASSLVNMSSLFGIVAPPGQTAYCSSKFAVRGFSESLRQELAHSPIAVTVVHPGGVATSIAKNARVSQGVSKEDAERGVRRMEKMLKTNPDAAAERIVSAIRRRQPRVLVGADCKQAEFIQRLFPVRYPALLGGILSRFSSLGPASS